MLPTFIGPTDAEDGVVTYLPKAGNNLPVDTM